MYKPWFKVFFANKCIIIPIGLGIIGDMLGKHYNSILVDKKCRKPQIKNGEILLTYIGLLCQVKTSLDAVNEMNNNLGFYKDSLDIDYDSLTNDESVTLIEILNKPIHMKNFSADVAKRTPYKAKKRRHSR